MCLCFRVQRDVLPSIEVLLLLASPRLLLAAVQLLCSSTRSPVTTKRLLVEEGVRQRFGEWSSASRTFYAVTAVLVVTRREVATVGRLSSFFLNIGDAGSTSSPAERAEASSSPPKNHEPNHDWFEEMARLVALGYGGESVSVPGCLRDGTGILCYLCSVSCPLP